MTLLIDNYDSFSYNLYQMISVIDPDITVVRNDKITVSEIETLNPERIIISPGPGKPSDAGICIETIRALGNHIPILGVCLGHQAIYEAFGGTVSHAGSIVHGKADDIRLNTDCPIFRGLPEVIKGARYHSLAGTEASLPKELIITARTADGEIMAISHRDYEIYGLQFHPESILTPTGKQIMANFLKGGN